MNETKHTPTPWTFQDISTVNANDGLGYINGADGIEIDHHGSNRRSKEENLANAIFKVEACNQHDSLKAERDAILEALKMDYETMIRMGWGGSTDPLLRKCAESTRAAIAKAEIEE